MKGLFVSIFAALMVLGVTHVTANAMPCMPGAVVHPMVNGQPSSQIMQLSAMDAPHWWCSMGRGGIMGVMNAQPIYGSGTQAYGMQQQYGYQPGYWQPPPVVMVVPMQGWGYNPGYGWHTHRRW